ncbi:hypothetical protein [Nocardioides albus]|uniref:Uncharacterized protein n=1 Tax=Nocardioides albus TaxID=1841 RepID=A0A7W5F9B8_9ACTN|nr:hypothetical protein [Nocardioides albus]MBB3089891.1 hypothetical protein [Nocardioides albus]GGU36378.1 hypothetical protein GCM10007979_39350 [Nocardioides albus]
MAYGLHLFRGDDWSDPEPFSIEEWDEFIAATSDVRGTGFVETTSPTGEAIRMVDPGLAEWTGHSHHPIILLFRNNRMTVTNPDDETIAWLVSIARPLRARIQGDEGEFYSNDGDTDSESPRAGWLYRLRRRT